MKTKNIPSISPIMRGPPFENLPHRLQKANAMLSPKSHQLRRNLKGVCILYKYNLKIIQIYNLTMIVWMWRFAQLSLKIWNLHNSWCKMVRKSSLVLASQSKKLKWNFHLKVATKHYMCIAADKLAAAPPGARFSKKKLKLRPEKIEEQHSIWPGEQLVTWLFFLEMPFKC